MAVDGIHLLPADSTRAVWATHGSPDCFQPLFGALVLLRDGKQGDGIKNAMLNAQLTAFAGGNIMVWGGISITGRTKDPIMQPVKISYLNNLGPASTMWE